MKFDRMTFIDFEHQVKDINGFGDLWIESHLDIKVKFPPILKGINIAVSPDRYK